MEEADRGRGERDGVAALSSSSLVLVDSGEDGGWWEGKGKKFCGLPDNKAVGSWDRPEEDSSYFSYEKTKSYHRLLLPRLVHSPLSLHPPPPSPPPSSSASSPSLFLLLLPLPPPLLSPLHIAALAPAGCLSCILLMECGGEPASSPQYSRADVCLW